MNTEIRKIDIQEKDLELVVSEKTLGSLTTNAKQIKALVESALPNYDIANYNESNIDLAKKDKAMLNNAAKVLNTKRIEFEKEFLKPFGEFKEVISETVKLISDCTSKIDLVVKQSEQIAKDQKRVDIQTYWETKQFSLVSLENIFDEKWLNKTTKEKDIFKEIDTKIAKINDDLVTIEAIGQDVELLKSIYLSDLDLNKTIQYANTLKQNKERARMEAEERARIEAEKAESVNTVKVQSEEKEPVEIVPVVTAPAEKHPVTPTQQSEPTTLTRYLKVIASKDLIIELAEFMNTKGIIFEKLENEKYA
jgi:Protein of unknown function (DUF1351)